MKMSHAYGKYYLEREYVIDTKMHHSHLLTDILKLSAPSASASAKRISIQDLMPFLGTPHKANESGRCIKAQLFHFIS